MNSYSFIDIDMGNHVNGCCNNGRMDRQTNIGGYKVSILGIEN